MLKVQLLTESAIAPKAAHPGEDIAYDLYADETVIVPPQSMKPVKTGVAIQFNPPAGAVLKSRSSMAKLHSSIEGGVIDAGYRGEIIVMVRNHSLSGHLQVNKGERVCQMLKAPVVTDKVKVVEKLSESKRGKKGFGSTGR